MIDWPNLLVGSLIGGLFSTLFYAQAKQDSEQNYRNLVAMLEKLQQKGAIKVEKDQRGIVLKVDPGEITLMGMPVVLRKSSEKETDGR